MTGPSVAIVCTTIGDGAFLKHYARAVAEYDGDVTMIVIPDRKTPKTLWDAAREYAEAGNPNRIYCPDLDMQTAFLERLGAPVGMFPFDTDYRRNIGYLMAYESGADVVISIDDDNLPVDGRWLTEHALSLTGPRELQTVSSYRHFWNPCILLEEMFGQYWPRGYPYSQRESDLSITVETATVTVAINEGLWLGDPDVDAITRLARRPVAHGVAQSRALAADTWAPVNSQNTAVRRDVIPAYYFFRSPRFGDIYQGYLAQACAKHLGQTVRFGSPVVRHERNDHDLLKDLEQELPDIQVLDEWLAWLTTTKPEGNSYGDAYESLAGQMEDLGMRAAYGSVRVRDRALAMAAQMRIWLKVCGRLA